MSKKESGFTLIEIVMVLVLLGILMAVAAPKYFDLQKEARIQAENAIVAEIQARVNGEFATQLLAGETCETASGNAVLSVKTGGDNAVTTDGDEWTATLNDDYSVTILWGEAPGQSTGVAHKITRPECKTN